MRRLLGSAALLAIAAAVLLPATVALVLHSPATKVPVDCTNVGQLLLVAVNAVRISPPVAVSRASSVGAVSRLIVRTLAAVSARSASCST